MASKPKAPSLSERFSDGRISDSLQRAHESGDKFALFNAVMIFSTAGLPLPKWATGAFLASWNKIIFAEAGSLDDAFGRPYPKGTHLGAIRRDPLKWRVLERVKEIKRTEGLPIDPGMFERVAEELNIGKTKCSDLYYSAQDESRRRRGIKATG